MQLEQGQTYDVTVTKILQRGIIVDVSGSESTEFIHISKISTRYVSDIAEFIRVGDNYTALCILGKDGRLELSLQHLHLKSLYNNRAGNTKPTQKSDVPGRTLTLDEMIAAADNSLKEKQRATNARLQRRCKSRHQKGE